LILSYLPDPVVAISTEGVITFCSMQVERVLKHNVSGLIGANIEDIIVPSSREAIRRLIRDLVTAEQRALSSSVEDRESGESNDRSEGEPNVGGESESNNSDRENNSAGPVGAHPHEVSEHSSEQSFPPLLEVKVKAGLTTSTEVAAGEDVSDSSGDPPSKNGQVKSSDGMTPTEMSSLTHKNSSFGDNSNDDQQAPPAAKKPKTSSANTTNSNEKKKPSTTTTTTESDETTSSENKANANLTKNVETCKLNKDKMGSEEVRFSHKDDVMGASVTANNAGAKLSSLMHHPKKKNFEAEVMGSGGDPSADAKQPPEQQEQAVPSIRRKQSSSSADSSTVSNPFMHADSVSKPTTKNQRSGNSSEDSGYRQSPGESDEYPEDSSSLSAASSNRSSKKKRRRTRPLAPACNVRLIRNDLSTIWCELTSSIRTRPPDDADMELNIIPQSQLKQGGNNIQKNNGSSNNNNNDESNESALSSEGSGQEEKELLLCFRPIREGDMVGEELRFSPNKASESEETMDGTSDDGPTNASSGDPNESAFTNYSSSSNKDGANGKMAPSKKVAAYNGADSPFFAKIQAAATAPSSSTSQVNKNRPPKKRKFESQEEKYMASDKKSCGENRYSTDDTQVDEPNEKSAVESMMELAKNPL
jgi:ribosomal protein L19E